MRKTLATALLVLALCCPALAGEIHTPPAAQPPAPPSAVNEQSTDGIIECPLTQIAVSLLGSVLALF